MRGWEIFSEEVRYKKWHVNLCFEMFTLTAVQITDYKKMKAYTVEFIRAKVVAVELEKEWI